MAHDRQFVMCSEIFFYTDGEKERPWVASTPQTLMIPPSRLSEQALLKLLVELSLSIFVILAHYASDSPTALSSTISAKPACVLAAAYTSATLVSSPFLNPARALGPAFVLNRWENHWVYWIGPIGGGAIAALLNEYVLSGNRGGRGVRRVSPRHQRANSGPEYDDGDNSSSLRSDDEMTYDDSRDKARVHKFAGGGYATYHPVAGSSIYGPGGPISQQQAQSHHNSNLERVESIYGGTKSLYCKSPPLTRANLNRSQSVYAKSPSGVAAALRGVDSGLVGGLPKPGPLVPAQSLYPIIRLNSSDATPNGSLRPNNNGSNNANAGAGLLVQPIQPLQQGQGQSQGQQPNYNSLNQNVQNQLAQCTQSIYGIRGIASSSGLGARDNIYGHLAGTPRAVEGIYGRAPAPPPHHQQAQQQIQIQPTRELQSSPSCHVLVPPPQQSPMSNGGSQQATLDLRRSAERPESAYGHTRRNGGSGGEDSAYGSYQSSLYGTASNRPVQVMGNPQQQQHRNSPNPQGQQQLQQQY
ncbi:hypothetical protein QAD02_022866 [Eretmocerus hayati]|uniref:Uncharacterized protein n=1 Tax=Eretmocerus hayati TaxID=131215 RepID=A0ACC2PXK8_9HYME|nr:hypothetical protein QAD02_022866 [Eretmocerus hayati]